MKNGNNNKGKSFIPAIKVKKSIEGTPFIVGKIFNPKDVKKLYPYIDFSNEDYFEYIFEGNNKFLVGDRVRIINKKEQKVYTIRRIKYKVIKDLLYVTYEMYNENEKGTIEEDEINLALAPSRWILSFSETTDKGIAVHEIDYFAWKKITNCCKSIFLFNTKKEAEKAKRMFTIYSMKDIMDCVESNAFRHNLSSLLEDNDM